jgi:hypothetical protein
MVDFPKDESLMPAGLDVWPFGKEDCPPTAGWKFNEERLQARLAVDHFRLPPDFRDPQAGVKHAQVEVPFVRFPRWHYCHHCGSMEFVSAYSPKRQRCFGRKLDGQTCSGKPERRRPFLIPVRIVAVCEDGHIEDFPFNEWLHQTRPSAESCTLRMRAGRSSAGLTGISIECSCGEKRVLGDVFKWDDEKGGPLARINCHCGALRPWLGELDRQPERCGRNLRVIQRGASNVYFPKIVSSLYIPLWAESETDTAIIRALEDPHIWSTLKQQLEDGRVDRARCATVADLCGVEPDRLYAAAQRKLEGALSATVDVQSMTEEQYRNTEYRAILEARGGAKTDLFVQTADVAEYEPVISRFFRSIRLLHKLRETRVLTGFSRIYPPDGGFQPGRLQDLRRSPSIRWLPAVKVYGEGIFLEFNPDLVARWEKENSETQVRAQMMERKLNDRREARGQPSRSVTAKFVLIHSFAHALINQLSFDCGYGSASLRERIYCDADQPDVPMQGVLIYTASGDSEGTMGGLVRQGKPGRLESTIVRAINRAAWCSSDPVCIESTGQGSDNSNLAACHGCALLPETSCEEGNRLLDRAMIIGRVDRRNVRGYFSSILTT